MEIKEMMIVSTGYKESLERMNAFIDERKPNFIESIKGYNIGEQFIIEIRYV